MSSVRKRFTKLGALIASLLLVTACASGPSVTPTGEVTKVTVTVKGMHYNPAVVEVPVGNELIITFENTDAVAHDLVLDNGVRSMHLAPGATEVIEVGIISADVDGWCSISNHRAMGMQMTVKAIG